MEVFAIFGKILVAWGLMVGFVWCIHKVDALDDEELEN